MLPDFYIIMGLLYILKEAETQNHVIKLMFLTVKMAVILVWLLNQKGSIHKTDEAESLKHVTELTELICTTEHHYKQVMQMHLHIYTLCDHIETMKDWPVPKSSPSNEERKHFFFFLFLENLRYIHVHTHACMNVCIM
jgi:hypothetical protein